MEDLIVKYKQLQPDQYLNLDTGNVVKRTTTYKKKFVEDNVCSDNKAKITSFLRTVNNTCCIDTDEFDVMYDKILKLEADYYLNLDTKRKVISKTANNKEFICHQLMCCSEEKVIITTFVNHITSKHKLLNKPVIIEKEGQCNYYSGNLPELLPMSSQSSGLPRGLPGGLPGMTQQSRSGKQKRKSSTNKGDTINADPIPSREGYAIINKSFIVKISKDGHGILVAMDNGNGNGLIERRPNNQEIIKAKQLKLLIPHWMEEDVEGDTSENDLIYQKICQLENDFYLNLSTGRKLNKNSAYNKEYVCDYPRCCTDDHQIMYNFIEYIKDKYDFVCNIITPNSQGMQVHTTHSPSINTTHSPSINTTHSPVMSSPVNAAKYRNSIKVHNSIVWKTYMSDKLEDKCYCCRTNKISSSIFALGHVKANIDGGNKDIDNLRPLCTSCNSSMREINMFIYMYHNKMPGFDRALKREPVNVFINIYDDNVNFEEFYKKFKSFMGKNNINALDKQSVRYYLKGRNMLNEDDVVMINNVVNDSDSD